MEELYEQQLIELQQQLVLLETENRALKNSINGQYSQNSLPSLNTLPSLDSSVKNQRKCNCKGKCATRSCGCVKNQQSCGQLCKCSKKMCKNHVSTKFIKLNLILNVYTKISLMRIIMHLIDIIKLYWRETIPNISEGHTYSR